MSTITTDDLKLHAESPAGLSTGRRLVRVDADLSYANLVGSNLTNADFTYSNLRGANFRDANLSGASLRETNLSYANFGGSNLTNADLTDADLSYANLVGSNLTNVNLTDANLANANLRDANLSGARGLNIATDAPARLLAVARAALQPGALEMGTWHTCETTHCMSGWAVYQAGEVGRVLEAVVGNHMAGLYLLGVEAAAHFYDSNEKATEYLQGVLDAAEQQEAG